MVYKPPMKRQRARQVVKDLATIKVLADPVRMRMLDLLEEPRTVRQLAAALDRPADRLYYHLKRLEEHALVEVVAERTFGGVIERTWRTCAAEILVDPEGEVPRSVAAAIAAEVLGQVAEGLGKAVRASDRRKDSAILALGYARLTDAQRADVVAQIERLMKHVGELARANEKAGRGRRHAVLAGMYRAERKG